MRISDWSSDVCSSDLLQLLAHLGRTEETAAHGARDGRSPPYELNKTEERIQLAVQRSGETGLPLIYVNQVGGQDELVFDGASRSEERRVGKECVSTCRSRWSPIH